MTGRNDPCPCASGKKYKRCCADADAVTHSAILKRQNMLTATARLRAGIFYAYPDDFDADDAWETLLLKLRQAADFCATLPYLGGEHAVH